jgi:hypothetical protein
VPTDLSVLLPFQHRVTGQFRAIVRDHKAGIAAQFSDTSNSLAIPRSRDKRLRSPGTLSLPIRKLFISKFLHLYESNTPK